MKNSFILFFTACLPTVFNVQVKSVASSFHSLFPDPDVIFLPCLNEAPIYLPHIFMCIGQELTENDDFVLFVNMMLPLKKLDNHYKASLYVETGFMS